MKLRIRSLESKQTHKIEVPNSCTLQQLKQSIAAQLSPSSSSSQSNLLLSLNRKDELCGSSPEVSLQSLGITSRDLIYYSHNPFAFSSQNPNLSHAQMDTQLEIRDFVSTQKGVPDELGEIDGGSDKKGEFIDAQMDGSLTSRNPNDQNRVLVSTQNLESGNSAELGGSSSETRELMDAQMEGPSNRSDNNDETRDSGSFGKEEPVGTMEPSKEIEYGDEMEVDEEPLVEAKANFSVPGFLKKVFAKEVGDAANGGNHKLLVIAVHAVLLESGFVGYDPVSGMKVDGFHLPDVWPSSAFGISLHYTLPDVPSTEVAETVVVKFQTLGKFVNVKGSLIKKGFGVHRVCLDEPWLLPALSFLCKKSDDTDSEKEANGSIKLYPNREIFEFWKMVKDELSYPLLIEFCENLGLVPPPCFMRLPTELKLNILESLPAADVARVACVCSELQFIASNDDLWRLKYEQEFGSAASVREGQWKSRFLSTWEFRKKRKRACMPYPLREPSLFRPVFPGRRGPNHFGPPFIFDGTVGGDYDRIPGLGIPQRAGGWRIFRRNCDLGGSMFEQI